MGLYREVQATEGVVVPEVGADGEGAEVEEDEQPRSMCELLPELGHHEMPQHPLLMLPTVGTRKILP